MERIEYGACAVNFELDDDGIVNGNVRGVILPNNECRRLGSDAVARRR